MMTVKTRVSAIIIVLMAAVFLSACADSAPGNEISGVLSKTGTDLALLGTVEGISEKAWTVSGRTVKLSDETRLDADLKIGDSVRIEVSLGEDGFMNALLIEGSSTDMFIVGAEIEFYAVVEEITPTVWLIGGFEVTVTPDTEIKADIVVGDFVKVHANVAEEGAFIATEIELPDDEDEHDRFEIEFVGAVEDITDEVWTVEGLELAITPRTEIGGFIQLGDLVKVHAYLGEGDGLIAREIELAEYDEHERDEIKFYGIVEVISDDLWTIGGREVVVTPQTVIKGLIQVGDFVEVHAFLGEGDSLIVREIELEDDDEDRDDWTKIKFYGFVEVITDDLWTIEGREVVITPQTEIEGLIRVGDFVEVHAYLSDGDTLIAREIELEGDDDDDDRDRKKVEFTGTVEAISNDEWVINGRTVLVTSETKIKDLIEVGDVVKVEAYEGEDGSLVAHEIELKDEDDDDHREEIKFKGTVEVISNGEWVIDGRSVVVTSETKIKDFIEVGDFVEVEAYEDEDGSLIALEIELEGDDDDSDDRDHDNDDRDDDDRDDHDDHDDDDHDDHDDDNEDHDDDRDEHDDHD